MTCADVDVRLRRAACVCTESLLLLKSSIGAAEAQLEADVASFLGLQACQKPLSSSAPHPFPPNESMEAAKTTLAWLPLAFRNKESIGTFSTCG